MPIAPHGPHAPHAPIAPPVHVYYGKVKHYSYDNSHGPDKYNKGYSGYGGYGDFGSGYSGRPSFGGSYGMGIDRGYGGKVGHDFGIRQSYDT